MNNNEQIQMLSSRLKHREALGPLLEDYKTFVNNLAAADHDHRSALRPLTEELPDLDRLLKRKYDAVLIGRLTDALGILKLKVAELEGAAPEPVEEEGALPQVEGRVRNIPNLGID